MKPAPVRAAVHAVLIWLGMLCMGLVLIAPALFVMARSAYGATATDVGAGFTSAGPTGATVADVLQARDNNPLGLANRIRLRANDTGLTPDPTCANICLADQLCIDDVDESATDDWRVCVGPADFFRIPNTGSDQLQSGEGLIGTGAGTGVFRQYLFSDVGGTCDISAQTNLAVTAPATLTGDTIGVADATSGAKGVVQLTGDLGGTAASPSVVDDSHNHTGATISGLDISDDTNLVAGAGLLLTNDTLSTASTEAGFLTDGATTDLTCSTSNQGKMQVLDDGELQWCDGATTSVLRRSAFGNAAGESTAAANDSVALTTDTTGNYVQSVATTAPLAGGAAGSEGAVLTLSLSQNAGTDVTADLEEEGQIGATVVSGNAANNQVILGNGTNTAAWGALTTASLPSGATLDTEWDTTTEINTATTDDDFVTLAGVQSITGRKTFSTLTYASDARTIADNGTGANATLTLDTTANVVPITCNDTQGCDITMSETSAVANQLVLIRNVSSSASINFADQTNVLTLWVSPWTIAPGHEITLLYDGTALKWVMDTGQWRAREGSTDKGVVGGVDFAAGDFDLTMTGDRLAVALDATVTHLGALIDAKSETTLPIAYTDQANTYGDDLQTFNRIKYQNDANTKRFDCGDTANDSCQYSGTYSNSADVATKAKVDARYTTQMTAAWTSTMFTHGLTTDHFFSNVPAGSGALNNGVTAYNKMPVSTTCTLKNTTVYMVSLGGGWPASATVTVWLRKNLTDLFSIAFTSTDDNTVKTDATTATLTAGTDFWVVRIQCSGTCTDNTAGKAVSVRVVFDCTAG